jgi:NAD(P)H-dependent flavin oxidoreductase YrpB (nitropropane dioxygenase family)
MLETAFTRLVGCSVPIQLAGMGSINGPELTAAVSAAGAFGQITFAGTLPKDAEARMNRIEEMTSKPFGVNLIIPFFDPAILRMVIPRARVVDFFWGEPDVRLIDQVHAGGALASWQVGSIREAINAEKAGCDFIIAQGIEAGGHIRGRLSLLPLLSAILDAVSVPVLAAGGIGTARSVAAVLFAGAAGARVGTRFIAAEESNAHPEYIRALIAARAEDAVQTTRFEVDCPMCPSQHRVLRSALEAAEALPDEPLGEIDISGERYPIDRFQGTVVSKQVEGRIDAMACYAGQSVGAVRRVQPAGEIVAELAGGAETLRERLATAQVAR